MRELSKVEMQAVSGAGVLGDLFDSLGKGASGIFSGITNVLTQGAKVFTDFVFNGIKGFWEGRYTR